MWKEDHRALFDACLGELKSDPIVLQMRSMKQHVKSVSCYDHCLFVAYASFTLCRALGLDYRAAARGGMLHDLYLERWDETDISRFARLLAHPYLALENARRFSLSEKECDIIVKHMWPLTRPLPRYAESFCVTLADKLCALVEQLHLFRLLGVARNVRAVRRAECLPAWYT